MAWAREDRDVGLVGATVDESGDFVDRVLH